MTERKPATEIAARVRDLSPHSLALIETLEDREIDGNDMLDSLMIAALGCIIASCENPAEIESEIDILLTRAKSLGTVMTVMKHVIDEEEQAHATAH